MIRFLIPIAIYFVAEYFCGAIAAMAVAIAYSTIELIIKYIRTKKIDSSPCIDIALIGLFGFAEHITNGIEGLMYVVLPIVVALLMLASLLTPLDLFASIGGSYMKKIQRSPFNQMNMRKSMLRMLVWCVIMAILEAIVYIEPSITHKYPEYQLFVVVVVLLAYIATEFVVGHINRRKYKNCEWVPLMNENAEIVGVAPRPLVHNGSLWLHPVVHLHVIHNHKLLLQLRPKTKKIQPNKWDTAVGGHITAQEKLEDALRREAWEEIGLRDFKARLQARYVWRSDVEHEYVFSFVTENAGPFRTINEGEVEELRFWSKQELLDNIDKGAFTPNLVHELQSSILALL
ncbi:MAG: NUDIX domain-containing protein [Marinilabiliaceae bacterium]|nr:NUDIX domain-containing protein [Marinilabiliaceae bacterium]